MKTTQIDTYIKHHSFISYQHDLLLHLTHTAHIMYNRK